MKEELKKSLKCDGYLLKVFGEAAEVDEIKELSDIGNPDNMSKAERKELCISVEKDKFDEDHYLADLFEDYILEQYISTEVSDMVKSFYGKKLDEDDISRLKDLPKRTYSLNHSQIQEALISLVDIVFAFCYDLRTTEGEHSVESGWTIAKLSATLSCFVAWDNLKECISSAFRRSVSYPMIRNFELSSCVFQDTVSIFASGRNSVLRCLLAIHKILATSGEFRYILNDLYITDYCVWIQSLSDEKFEEFAKELSSIEIQKSDVDLDLETVELAGNLAQMKCDEGGPSETETKSSADVLRIIAKNIKTVAESDDDSDDN